MQQKDQKLFRDLQNNIRTGITDKSTEDVLKSQFILKPCDHYLHALCIFEANAPINRYNEFM